jgi:pilus assembly protein CpaE
VPDQTERTRVVAIIDPGPVEQQIASALNSQPDFQLVDLITSMDKAPQTLRAARAELVLVAHELDGEPTIDVVDDLALQFPEVALVALLPDGEPQTTQRAMLAGARAFLIQPFTQLNLLSTLRRVRDLEARRARPRAPEAAQTAEGSQPLRVVSVYGPRGGVGTSTLALNLAVGLFEATGQRVLLLEGKLGFSHLGLMLNLRTRNTLAELLPHAHHLEENLVREVVVEHASGMHVLLAPSSLEVAQGVRPEALFSVVDGIRPFFDYVVIDAGSALTENAVTLLDLADRVLLVATPDLAALHDTSRFIQVSRSLAYAPGKVLTVLNRTGQVGSLRVKDIENALHHEVFARIPDDGPNALRSLNRGLPLLRRYPRSAASRGIIGLARSLLRMGQVQPGVAVQPGSSPARGLRLARREKALKPAEAPQS